MTIFISDLHLGNKHSQAGRFYTWIEKQDRHEPLYLVGDIIDDHQMKEWPQSHINALIAILSFHNIKYCPGNHDKFFKRFGYVMFDNIIMNKELAYHSPDEKVYLVLHGDQQDWTMKYAIISSKLVGHNIRRWVSKLHSLIGANNDVITQYAKEKGFDGVICGHSHEPFIGMVNMMHYINCGDFITNCTVVVNRNNGFELIQL